MDLNPPKVVALGVPCPPFPGNPLDPPLRSRFQARHISRVPAVSWRICWCLYSLRLGQAADGSGLFWCLLFYVDVVLWLFSCCWFVCMRDSYGSLWVCNAVIYKASSTTSIQWFCEFDPYTSQLGGGAEIPPTLFNHVTSTILARCVFHLDWRIPRTWKGWPLIALRIPKVSEVEQESLGWIEQTSSKDCWVWFINKLKSLIWDSFLSDW